MYSRGATLFDTAAFICPGAYHAIVWPAVTSLGCCWRENHSPGPTCALALSSGHRSRARSRVWLFSPGLSPSPVRC